MILQEDCCISKTCCMLKCTEGFPLEEIAQANITLLGAFTFSCLISCISFVSVLNVVLHFLTVLKNVQCAVQCFIFFITRTLL